MCDINDLSISRPNGSIDGSVITRLNAQQPSPGLMSGAL